jgi:arsenite methyltransferase
MGTPNHALAIERYRRHAPSYDNTTHRMEPVRQRAIDGLLLKPGDTVLDVACGTGKSFALIETQIGPAGRLIGIDQSPDMLSIAQQRVRNGGWSNVTLIESSMEQAQIPEKVDAILFNYAHDVLQSKPALDNVFASAKYGARIVSAGMRYFPWWLGPLNIVVLIKAYPYATTLQGFNRPWSVLANYVESLSTESMYCGIAYVARACYPGMQAIRSRSCDVS